jgi:hypothetical protein
LVGWIISSGAHYCWWFLGIVTINKLLVLPKRWAMPISSSLLFHDAIALLLATSTSTFCLFVLPNVCGVVEYTYNNVLVIYCSVIAGCQYLFGSHGGVGK